jgi:hypothetical protein
MPDDFQSSRGGFSIINENRRYLGVSTHWCGTTLDITAFNLGTFGRSYYTFCAGVGSCGFVGKSLTASSLRLGRDGSVFGSGSLVLHRLQGLTEKCLLLIHDDGLSSHYRSLATIDTIRSVQDPQSQSREKQAQHRENDTCFRCDFSPFELIGFVLAPLSILGIVADLKMFDGSCELARKDSIALLIGSSGTAGFSAS